MMSMTYSISIPLRGFPRLSKQSQLSQLSTDCIALSRFCYVLLKAKVVAPLISQQSQRVIDHAAEGLAVLGDVAAPLVLPYLIHGERSERQAAVQVLRRLREAGTKRCC